MRGVELGAVESIAIMRRTLVIAALSITLLGACEADDASPDGAASPVSETTVTGSPRQLTDDGFEFDIGEIGVGERGYVSLSNFTDSSASLDGLYLCQSSGCVELPDLEVDDGETVRVATFDGDGLDGAILTDAPLDLSPSDGEIALMASEDVGDGDAMRVYVQWGTTPHDMTGNAVDAGLWIEGGYAPTSENATRLFVDENGLWLFDE